MKLKHLESRIQSCCTVTDFNRKPLIQLEQYSTPPRLAAELALIMDGEDEIEGKNLADFGCGCGVLSAAVLQFEPGTLLAIDIDTKCLQITSDNLSDFSVDFLQCDIVNGVPLQRDSFDAVITNPPFGTRKQGADISFVNEALKVAPIVYSFHKESTRQFVQKTADELSLIHI